MMEAKETQPPEMPTGPRCTMTARSKPGVEDADKKGKGGRQQHLPGQIPRRQVAHRDEGHRVNKKGDERGYFVFAEGDHGNDKRQGGEQLRPRVQPVQGGLLVGEGFQVAEIQ